MGVSVALTWRKLKVGDDERCLVSVEGAIYLIEGLLNLLSHAMGLGITCHQKGAYTPCWRHMAAH